LEFLARWIGLQSSARLKVRTAPVSLVLSQREWCSGKTISIQKESELLH
jgi:hypothetical protein